MAAGDRSHSGRWLRRSGATSVILVLVLAGLAYQFDLGRRLGLDAPSPVTEPSEVAPPPGLTLPSPTTAPVVAAETSDRDAAPRMVRRALSGLVSDKKLGRRVSVAVSQLADGRSVYRTGAGLVTPASTMKLLTSAAVMERLGPDHRFRTTVLLEPRSGRVVLVGGGDPFLERAQVPRDDTYPVRADLNTLAEATAIALKERGRTTVRVSYDTSLFSGPAASPAWEASYVPDDVVTPVSALWTNEGRTRSGSVASDPAAVAAQSFAKALARQRVVVLGEPRPTKAAAGADELAAVESAPLEQIVERVLQVSDNEASEVLFRHVAVAAGRRASFAGASQAVRSVLDRVGVDLSGARIFDGSGLSRKNRLAPETLLSVIEVSSGDEHPSLRPVVTGLPVAGFNGSLAYRFETGDKRGPGRVRAKTGTLTGVHGLAGVVTDLEGTELAFVALADRVKVANTLDARALLDEVAAALAGCACGTT